MDPRRLAAYAAMLLSLTACKAPTIGRGDPTPADAADPCAGVDCTSRGTCINDGGVPACVCDAGFHAAGVECLADAAPCDGITCSGHGRCVDQGGARCECDAGYHAEGLTCAADPVDCSGVDTLCVDDTPGPRQEFATLQAAAAVVQPGQTIVVFDGDYAGFVLDTSGAPGARITVRADGAAARITSDGPSQGAGVLLQNLSDVTVEGLHIVGVSGRGIAHRGATADQPARRLRLRDNTIDASGTEGMYLSQVADSLIERNIIRGAGASGASLTHGIYLANGGSDNTTLRGNVISDSGTAGIHMNGDLSVGGDGIISGLLVEGNILRDNGQNGLNMDGVQDSVIRNNLIYGNASNGVRAYVIDGAAGPNRLVLVNNTVVVPASAGWCLRITEDGGDNIAFNNILISDNPATGSIALDRTAGFASAANVVVDRFTPDRDTTMLSLSEWQALGYDADSVVATSAQVFVGGGDYHLAGDSTALDLGRATFAGVSAPAYDLEDRARTGTVDAGAYEGT